MNDESEILLVTFQLWKKDSKYPVSRLPRPHTLEETCDLIFKTLLLIP